MPPLCKVFPTVLYCPSPPTPVSLTPLHSCTTPACIVPARVLHLYASVEGSYRGPLVPLCPVWYCQSRDPLQESAIVGYAVQLSRGNFPIYRVMLVNTANTLKSRRIPPTGKVLEV